MMAVRGLSLGNTGIPAGAWRWAALVLAVLAIGAAAVAVIDTGCIALGGRDAARRHRRRRVDLSLRGVAKETLNTADARRVAEAASRANVAWAITGTDGAVLDCNDVYRRMSGAQPGESAPPPELALAGETSSPVLYRLTRGGAEGTAREESFIVAPGLEIVAAVRPLSNKQTAWWFTPRLAPSAAHTQAAVAAAAPVARPAETGVGEMFRDAPMGMAFASADGILVDANRAFGNFFGAQASLAGRTLAELAAPSDRTGIAELIAKGFAGSIELRAEGERAAELFAHPLQRTAASFSTSWTCRSRKHSKPNSPSRRRCRLWDNSPAAWRTISTTC